MNASSDLSISIIKFSCNIRSITVSYIPSYVPTFVGLSPSDLPPHLSTLLSFVELDPDLDTVLLVGVRPEIGVGVEISEFVTVLSLATDA